jgi:NAD+ diphosphatase
LLKYELQRRFTGKYYSALAGFIEPGESFEDAVAREMWEEAGVNVWNIKYHSSQPWVRGLRRTKSSPDQTDHQPDPANVMVGFYARADSSKPIRTDLDNELVGQYCGFQPPKMGAVAENLSLDARWFTRDEILAILIHESGTKFGKDHKKLAENTVDRSKTAKSTLEPAQQVLRPADTTTAPQPRFAERKPSWELPFQLPAVRSIAGVLIRDWAEKKIGFPLEDTIL